MHNYPQSTYLRGTLAFNCRKAAQNYFGICFKIPFSMAPNGSRSYLDQFGLPQGIVWFRPLYSQAPSKKFFGNFLLDELKCIVTSHGIGICTILSVRHFMHNILYTCMGLSIILCTLLRSYIDSLLCTTIG